VSNTRNLYWIALAFLVVAYLIVWLVTESVTGHVFVAVRENELRLDVLGVRPYRFKLVSFVVSSLIATGGGIVYILVIGTAVPSVVASTTVTLSILIMVVLGGAGTRWGAVIGAIVYVYLQQYLDKVGAEPSFTRLPAVPASATFGATVSARGHIRPLRVLRSGGHRRPRPSPPAQPGIRGHTFVSIQEVLNARCVDEDFVRIGVRRLEKGRWRMTLEGKVALVTGSTSGIGLGIAARSPGRSLDHDERLR